MNCDQTRTLLSLEPAGTAFPANSAARAHLRGCAACRAFWRALGRVDEALATRPLAVPAPGLAEDLLAQIRSYPRQEVEPPFSRAFWAVGAALTLFSLVSGALLLHCWSLAPSGGLDSPPALWLGPAWSRNASAWLSIEGERLAQIVLPVLAGTVVTLVGAAIGFRASGRNSDPAPSPHEQPRSPR